MSATAKYDAIFLGSGISSLVGAILLGMHGKRVLVLEQHYKPGGNLHCFTRFGLQFESGGHYMGALDKGQPFRALLEYLGVYEPKQFIRLHEDFDRLVFPGFKAAYHQGYEQTTEVLSSLFPEEAQNLTRYFALIQRLALAFPTYSFRWERDDQVLHEAMSTSLQKIVEASVQNPKLKSVLYAHCALHGVEPQDVSIGLHALVTDSLMRGCYGFTQGGDALAKTMVERVKALGGEVRLQSSVTKLVTKGDRIEEAVLESGESYQADQFLSGIHPRSLLDMMEPSSFRPVFTERIRNMRETVSLFGIYAHCEGQVCIDPLSSTYIYRSDHYQDWFDLGQPGQAPPILYLTRCDRENQTASKQAVTMYGPAPYEWFEGWKETPSGKRPLEYDGVKARIQKAYLDLVETQIPGFRATVKQACDSTPLTHEHFNRGWQGSPFGIYHSIANTGIRAIGPRTKVNNLLLTGHNTLSPGFLGASISGLRTAGQLLDFKGLLSQLRERLA